MRDLCCSSWTGGHNNQDPYYTLKQIWYWLLRSPHIWSRVDHLDPTQETIPTVGQADVYVRPDRPPTRHYEPRHGGTYSEEESIICPGTLKIVLSIGHALLSLLIRSNSRRWWMLVLLRGAIVNRTYGTPKNLLYQYIFPPS